MALPFLAAIAPEILSAGLGAFQTVQGNKFGRIERPEKQISDSDKEALNISRSLATTREAPGVTGAKRELDAGVSEALDVARRTGNVDIATMYGNKTKALLELSDTNVNFNNASMAALVGDLQQMGDKEDQVWDYNVNQPYQNQVQTAAALKGAGVQNISNSLNDISALGLNKMGLDAFTEIFQPQPIPGNNVDPNVRTTRATPSSGAVNGGGVGTNANNSSYTNSSGYTVNPESGMPVTEQNTMQILLGLLKNGLKLPGQFEY